MIQFTSDSDFYHQDFTTASDWEIFIARLEEIFHEWKLSKLKKNAPPLAKNQLFDGNWEYQSEVAKFADVEFNVTRHHLKVEDVDSDGASYVSYDSNLIKLQALDDMMSPENDFLPVISNPDKIYPHWLVRWYGLRDFITLTPVLGNPVSTESQVKMLLSSFCIAVNNSECEIPIFVQALEPWQNFYMGVCEGKNIRAEYEMVHLRNIPQGCKHLTGLLNVFKTKIGSPIPLNSIIISARFSYLLSDWTNFVWMQEPPDFDFMQGKALGVSELGQLPFGATFDPVSKLMLFVTWPELFETSVVDSESYTDLEPLQANDWSVSIKVHDNPSCLLSDAYLEFLQVCSTSKSMPELVGDLIQKNQAQVLDPSVPLSLLSESKVPTFSKILKQATSSIDYGRPREGPLAEDLLVHILYYLFPDAEENQKYPYPEQLALDGGKEKSDFFTELGWLNGFKSAPYDSLVWRLAIVMCHAAHTLGGMKAVAHLWYEFTQELRFRWERCIFIPGVVAAFPDMKSCLLNQKLQMLNCCMKRRKTREKGTNETVELTEGEEFEDTVEEEEEEEEDDEFFDCPVESETIPDEVDNGTDAKKQTKRHKYSLWNQPAGRLNRHGDLKLINTGEPLYIPITQELTPKSEDQLEEDAAILLELGTDKEGAELRARIMSASLLSDMEAFKAANPGAVIEDFIRWYSPRDWIEKDGLDEYGQKKGQLSARMQLPGNTWLEVWQTAKPVPAKRQKQLFDDAREAEKVLHFLDSRQPFQFAQMLLSTLTHVSIFQLLEHSKKSHIKKLNNNLQHISKKGVSLSRTGLPDMKRYQELAQEIATAETLISQSLSLQLKLCPEMKSENLSDDLSEFLSSLLFDPETSVPNGPRGEVGSKIVSMFSEAHKAAQMISDSEPVVGEPWDSMNVSVWANAEYEKEFILRSTAFRPASFSTLTPQRMSVRINKDQIMMAGCWTQDTSFQ